MGGVSVGTKIPRCLISTLQKLAGPFGTPCIAGKLFATLTRSKLFLAVCISCGQMEKCGNCKTYLWRLLDWDCTTMQGHVRGWTNLRSRVKVLLRERRLTICYHMKIRSDIPPIRWYFFWLLKLEAYRSENLTSA